MGKEFFKIVERHFTRDHSYYAIMNKNTIKLWYSCMMNMKNIIKAHNSKILQPPRVEEGAQKKSCSCTKKQKDECPLGGHCLTENVIYKAIVKTETCEKEYIGSTGRAFKDRFNEHKYAFMHKGSLKSTKLSEHVWSAKEKGEKPEIKWSIMHKAPKPRGPQKICTICNLERIEIAAADRKKALNKRSELTGSCVHFRRFYFHRSRKKPGQHG